MLTHCRFLRRLGAIHFEMMINLLFFAPEFFAGTGGEEREGQRVSVHWYGCSTGRCPQTAQDTPYRERY